jgi:hypothetical protein
MLVQDFQVIVIDPTDVWWGLNTGQWSIAIFGGEHGDLPLEPGTGKLLAETLVQTGQSAVLSLRHLSKAKQRAFVAEFAETLYHAKGEGRYRTPVHVIIDEADAFVPQRVMGDVARAHGAIDDLVRRGRSSGIGVSLITQRAAVISKDVLSQVDALVAFRMVSPQDRKALDAWVEAHDTHDMAKTFADSLASLPQGVGWWWSPSWLDLFVQARVTQCRSFDSSATPKLGQKLDAPKRKPLDFDRLRERMAEVVEQAEANDPRALKAKISKLERELQARPEGIRVEEVIKEVEVLVPNDAEMVALRAQIESRMGELRDELTTQMRTYIDGAIKRAGLRTVGRRWPTKVVYDPPATGRGARHPQPLVEVLREPQHDGRTRRDGSTSLKKAEKLILSALASQHSGEGMTARQIATIAGYSAKGGGFQNSLSALRTAGLISGSGSIRITDDGREALGPVEPLPTGPALLDFWVHRTDQAKLPKVCKAILLALRDLRGVGTNVEIATMSQYEASGGGFQNGLSRLRTLGLITSSGGNNYLADELL